jgi:hypothetical protein
VLCANNVSKAPPTFASLEGLLENGRRDGFDIRPTLLRVLTDLYLQKPAHTLEDERYYTELALRLINSTDMPTRAAVAERLAAYSAAPRQVVLRLARDVIEVAAPILRQSACLTLADLAEIGTECGAAHAELAAARMPSQPPPAEVVPAVAVEQTPERNPDADPAAVELAEIFFGAGADERRLIILNLDSGTPDQSSPPPMSDTARRLEIAALEHRTDAFARELEAALGISGRMARRIVEDGLGEPIVVAAKALQAPRAVLERILLFLNPRVGQSVQRVYELAACYDEISVAAARQLISIWRDADPRAPAPRPVHQPSATRRLELVRPSQPLFGRRQEKSWQELKSRG